MNKEIVVPLQDLIWMIQMFPNHLNFAVCPDKEYQARFNFKRDLVDALEKKYGKDTP